MADQIDDAYESQLLKDLESASESSKSAVSEYTLAEKRRWLLTKQLQAELLGQKGSSTALIDKLRGENDSLKQAAIWAREQNGAALSAGGFWTFDEPPDLDKIIQGWVYAAKSGQEKSLEKLLFGEELKPERTTIAEKSAAAFQNPEDNWTVIANIFKQESKAREDAVDAYQRAILALAAENGKETFFPSGPTKLELDELEEKLKASKRRLTHYHDLLEKNRLFLAGTAAGRWTDEEIERGARELSQEQMEKEAKPQEEATAAGGKVMIQSPAEKKEEVKAVEKVAKKPSEAELIRRGLVESGEIEGVWTFRDYLRHPIGGSGRAIGFLRGYLGGLFSRGGGVTAEQPASAVTEERAGTGFVGSAAGKAAGAGTKKVAGAVAKKVAPGLVAKLAGFIPMGVTQVTAIASIVKDILGTIKGIFTNPAIRDAIRDAGAAAAILLKMLVDFILSSVWTMAGGAIGGFVGLAVGGPIGGLVGAAAGAWLVGTIGPQIWASITSFLSGAGTAGTAAATSVASVGASVVGGVAVASGTVVTAITAAITGGAGIVIIAVGATIIGTVITVVSTAAAFVQPPEEIGIDQSREASFLVTKTANPASLPSYDGTSNTITYSLSISLSSEDIKIESVVDEKKLNATVLSTDNIDLAKFSKNGTNLTTSYAYDISGDKFKNSDLLDTVTVTAVDNKTNQRSTEIASFNIRIGKPTSSQPYGFPAAGYVTSLDTIFGTLGDKKIHCSIFSGTKVASKGCIPGGIDIVDKNGTDVFSTSDGTVILSRYEDVDTGGAIYVSSPPYIIEYLHLSEDSIKAFQASGAKQVTRGQKLARTSLKTYKYSTAPHVHYQIVSETGGPVNFTDPANAGKCSDGKIEPIIPKQRQTISGNLVAPACN